MLELPFQPQQPSRKIARASLLASRAVALVITLLLVPPRHKQHLRRYPQLRQVIVLPQRRNRTFATQCVLLSVFEDLKASILTYE
jgi:hypothetical protein